MHINLETKFGMFTEHWRPYIVGELNDNFVKIAKVKGEFVWHHHEFEDEMFIVVEGTLMVDFHDKTVAIRPGEILIVPKGVEHRPWTENGQEVKIMLVEPKSTLHTGGTKSDLTVENLRWI
jgi:mannose-6-phosphate isomerase-like protein (cupin superfamily)